MEPRGMDAPASLSRPVTGTEPSDAQDCIRIRPANCISDLSVSCTDGAL